MSISRIINKTPIQNEKSNVYEVDQIDSKLIQSVIQSRFISEGIYSIEQLSMPEYNERYITSPSFDKLSLTCSEKEWKFDPKDVFVYQLQLSKPFFLPLDVEKFINFYNFISEFKDITLFTQTLICKRQDNWRETAVDQYYSYKDGNDYPISNKMMRNIQNKALNVLNKISNFNICRDSIEEIEQKILQNAYRFECRFVLFDEKHCKYFEKEISKELDKITLFNELELKKFSNKKQLIKYIEGREFQSDLVNQLLSEQEVYSLLCNENNLSENPIPLKIPNPIEKKSIVKTIEDNMFIQRAIQILPYKERQNKDIDSSLPSRINNAFQRVGITKRQLKVVETHLGSSLLKVQMEVPSDIVFTSFKKKLEDIQGALGNKGISIEMGDKPDTINIYMPLEERDVIYFKEIFESEEFQEFCKNNPLPFIIGDNVNGGYMFGCLSKFRHLLIAGTSGSGKSVFLTLILLCLLLTVPFDELDMYLIDPKMVELSMFYGFPQVKPIITDMSQATDLLEKLCVEMDKRYEEMAKLGGVREIAIYNKKSDVKMRYIVVGVDEFADLIMTNPNVEDYIVRIAQKGRGAGIHLALATQRPSVDVVTGLIKGNMPARFAFKATSGVDSKTILDTVGAEKLLGLGDGLALIEGNPKGIERFQAPLLTLNKLDEEEIYDKLKQLFKNTPKNNDELSEINIPKKEDPIDQIKRIIATTGETRISKLRELMEIRINIVQDLVQQLAAEGWLSKENNKYVITADEDELNKWREH